MSNEEREGSWVAKRENARWDGKEKKREKEEERGARVGVGPFRLHMCAQMGSYRVDFFFYFIFLSFFFLWIVGFLLPLSPFMPLSLRRGGVEERGP